jgi:ribose 5-phosphate isomerase B
MKIAVGSDHRGFEVKEQIKGIVVELGHECIDVGTTNRNPVDYADIAYLATTMVVKKQADRAILACSTGLGMSIAANKMKGIRAALCHDELCTKISRHHYHANILCISADQSREVLLRKIVEIWLNTETDGGRHLRRVNKITAIEESKDPREIEMRVQN